MIITASCQREIEKQAKSFGIPELTLMENAGNMAFRYISDCFDISGKNVVVLCGSGGNAGDGFVVSRCLALSGTQPTAVLCCGFPKNEAAVMYRAAVAEGTEILDNKRTPEAVRGLIESADIIIDAVYGIGFHGNLDNELVELFDTVNRSHATVIALDIPSGVEADSARADDGAIMADITLCFIGMKYANILKSAGRYCGSSLLLDIGIPGEVYDTADYDSFVLDGSVVFPLLEPKSKLSHKGTMGRVLVVAGSSLYRGAAVICAGGAMRAGAGLTEVASVPQVLDAVINALPEAVLFDISDNPEDFAAHVKRANACVVGPGLTTSERALTVLEHALESASGTVVIDADGINLISERIELLSGSNGKPYILTPHVKEFSRLCGASVEAILADRINMARTFAKEYGCVLVLKSENTVIAAPNGEVFVNVKGNPGLAKGGSGDLLSGMIAAFAAMGKTPLQAAQLGVYLHSSAADICAEDGDEYSMVISDVAKYIGAAIKKLLERKE